MFKKLVAGVLLASVALTAVVPAVSAAPESKGQVKSGKNAVERIVGYSANNNDRLDTLIAAVTCDYFGGDFVDVLSTAEQVKERKRDKTLIPIVRAIHAGPLLPPDQRAIGTGVPLDKIDRSAVHEVKQVALANGPIGWGLPPAHLDRCGGARYIRCHVFLLVKLAWHDARTIACQQCTTNCAIRAKRTLVGRAHQHHPRAVQASVPPDVLLSTTYGDIPLDYGPCLRINGRYAS